MRASFVLHTDSQFLQCWCSEEGDSSDYDRHGTATCDMNCPGSLSERCGGEWSVSVYRSGDSLPSSTYLGCFRDRASEDRIFSSRVRTSTPMSSAVSVLERSHAIMPECRERSTAVGRMAVWWEVTNDGGHSFIPTMESRTEDVQQMIAYVRLHRTARCCWQLDACCCGLLVSCLRRPSLDRWPQASVETVCRTSEAPQEDFIHIEAVSTRWGGLLKDFVVVLSRPKTHRYSVC